MSDVHIHASLTTRPWPTPAPNASTRAASESSKKKKKNRKKNALNAQRTFGCLDNGRGGGGRGCMQY
jgi:hypothetical protein